MATGWQSFPMICSCYIDSILERLVQMRTIEVKVRLYGMLRKYSPGTGIGEAVVLPIPEGTHLAELPARLSVPEKEVKLTFVNNQQQGDNYLLQDGDQVAIFPLVAGG